MSLFIFVWICCEAFSGSRFFEIRFCVSFSCVYRLFIWLLICVVSSVSFFS